MSDIYRLARYCAEGRVKEMKDLLDKGSVNVNDYWQPDDDDWECGRIDDWFINQGKALHYAMICDKPESLKLLLSTEDIRPVLKGVHKKPVFLKNEPFHEECNYMA